MSGMETREKDTINVNLFSKGIKGVAYFVYREAGKKRKFIKLSTTSGTIIITDIKARRQFLSYFDLKLREMERMWTPEERNEKVMEAIGQRAFDELSGNKQPLVFRCHRRTDGSYDAWSVVTSDYVEVPTKEAIEFFEKVLQEKGYGDSKLVKRWDSGKAVFSVYNLMESPTKPVKVGDIASCGMVLRAGYSGDRSVGLSGHYTVLACTNGMTNNRQVMAYRGIHRGMSKESILGKVEQAFDVAVAELPMLETLVEDAKEPLTEDEEKEMLDKVLDKYPEHIKEAIKKAMKKYADTEGKFRISQAISDTATHYAHATDNYRNDLEKEAFRVLTIPIIRKKKKKKKEKNR